ncbi:hypothetical protein ABGT15_05740 [Flavobacterium enshiense]|uniref:hypothetical protein n=1 Tax=Flavobacterium enshiense TaxID=1341165 RepID=UPI00345DB649
MKKKLKNLFYLSLLLSGLIIVGCELQEDVIDQHNHKQNLKMYEKTFDELMSDEKFVNSFNKLPKSKKKISTSAIGKTVMEEEYGFIITDKPAIIIESEQGVSYTFNITRELISDDYFENLIIENQPNNITKAYIVKYNIPITNNSLLLSSNYNEANTIITPIVYNNNIVSPNSKLYPSGETCMTYYFPMCEVTGGSYNSDHIANSDQCVTSYYSIETVCFPSGVGGEPPTNSDPTNPNPSDGSDTGENYEGGHDPNPEEDPIITSPNLPEFEEYKIINETNCLKLKKLIETTQLNPVNSFKEALEQNQHDAENGNFEKGFKLTYSPTTNSFNIAEAPNSASNCSKINFFPSANMIGNFTVIQFHAG